ncbi:ImmA/IrrE family metallo-endopeptidase [Aeromicrobium terrae]
MSSDPQVALERDSSVTVRWVEPSVLPGGCSIAATYVGATVPAEISVALDASPGRRRFSLVHEYGHHLRDQVFEVLTDLFASTDPGWLEEKMCDAFASLVLVPLATREQAFTNGVTARAVLDLMSRVSASEEAVAVASAESMSHPGYVMLLNELGEAEFTARSGDVFPIPRSTPQSGLALRAASGALVRGIDRLNQGISRTGEMHIDAATDTGRTVLVAVDGQAPWTRFGGGRAYSAEFEERHCEYCSASFAVLTTPCPRCGEPPCSECSRCACHEEQLVGARTCDTCWTIQPPAAFESTDATTCLGCS